MSSREYETRENNQNKNEESSNSFLLGALLGGMVGAATALLLAPKSGKELRDTLNSQTGSFRGKTGLMRENVLNKGNEFASRTVTLTQGLVHHSSDLMNKAKTKTKTNDEYKEKSEINYIPINSPIVKMDSKKTESPGDSFDIRIKLEETKKAFEEEEYKIKH